MYKQHIVIVCGLVFLPSIIQAKPICKTTNIPATTPTGQFSTSKNGTVTDTKTGLVWKKCSEGQSWNPSTNTCTGSASNFDWRGALNRAQLTNKKGGFAQKTDWRLPNLKELNSITEERCYAPAINTSVFPNTPSAWYWSSSPRSYGDPKNAWYIDFNTGASRWDYKVQFNVKVRLVRSGL